MRRWSINKSTNIGNIKVFSIPAFVKYAPSTYLNCAIAYLTITWRDLRVIEVTWRVMLASFPTDFVFPPLDKIFQKSTQTVLAEIQDLRMNSKVIRSTLKYTRSGSFIFGQYRTLHHFA